MSGQCQSTLEIGDDYGDHHATMKCQLAKKHKGAHEERYTSSELNEVVVTWTKRSKIQP